MAGGRHRPLVVRNQGKNTYKAQCLMYDAFKYVHSSIHQPASPFLLAQLSLFPIPQPPPTPHPQVESIRQVNASAVSLTLATSDRRGAKMDVTIALDGGVVVEEEAEAVVAMELRARGGGCVWMWNFEI